MRGRLERFMVEFFSFMVELFITLGLLTAMLFAAMLIGWLFWG